ncbi:VOC family protein [Paenibacillus terrigena]|uniref:VOC family protein n=1 Tax=Paenibacillus terrigena TaxID=369333 RepID=UPI00036CB7F0|nr:VOC family protein [Paenibacillus terrigena]
MKFSHVRLLVSNVRECFIFYRDILGLEVLYGNEDTPFAEFKTGDIHIALEPPMASEPIAAFRNKNEFSALDQVALIFRVDDVDATYDRLKSREVEFVKEPHDTLEWNMRVAYFRDPAGNLIEINQGI